MGCTAILAGGVTRQASTAQGMDAVAGWAWLKESGFAAVAALRAVEAQREKKGTGTGAIIF